MTIIQGTKEWLEAKKKTIGASEIFTLVHHYCSNELRDYADQCGINLIKEKPFRTVQELFIKVFYEVETSNIDPDVARFGLKMEDYVASVVLNDIQSCNIDRPNDFVKNESLHSLASCPPDRDWET